MTAVHPALTAMPTTRRAILDALKRHGQLRAEDLAEHTGITASGIRQHLQTLQNDGLIGHLEKRDGRGRPKFAYRLTDAADALYPRTYSELTNELLDYVQDDDPALLERIFERRRERRLQRAKSRLEGLRSLDAKVQELVRILDEDGYLADREAIPGGWRITEHNCAILGVALKYGQACGSELEFIRAALPGTSIERVAHMVAGAHVCAYEIKATKKPRNR